MVSGTFADAVGGVGGVGGVVVVGGGVDVAVEVPALHPMITLDAAREERKARRLRCFFTK